MIISVVTWPTGQLVTVGAQDVTVYTEVVIMVEVRVGYEVGAVTEELLYDLEDKVLIGVVG